MVRKLRHGLVALVVGAVSAVGVVATAGPAAALPAFGTGAVTLAATGNGGGAIRSVTVGRHDSEGFDRVVWTFPGAGTPQVHVEYVSAVHHDPSDKVVPLLGNAFVHVVMQGGSPSPQGTITPAGFLALKQVKGAGDFESVVSYGVGQAAKRGFRVFTLTGPSRVVLDVRA
jgi:hypothetical protein